MLAMRRLTPCWPATGSCRVCCRADKDAAAGKDTYRDDYFETFFTKVRPVLEERLGTAITATASLLWGAWEQAGRPTLRSERQ
jgi:hypothetical protein